MVGTLGGATGLTLGGATGLTLGDGAGLSFGSDLKGRGGDSSAKNGSNFGKGIKNGRSKG